ncbi:uncharacterized protein PHACADRAFT_169181 [Phanerochaete carnosa HHB-10118-sp]|uniref:MYND-type domain-containing protein n=1 Tax=Phanerochaete carnosa (strain HHB-10118-sp) TaxID=650164 RepID=K5WR68_PHACS|nr:uncharacterized protein PHACADRAFT_169181 [Phanerochaete carnosa HHB-10118-sp]EKM61754.1 hypothetical protein PHACADRAFT_169181 [Phanerochaete carnosa HHB-10118-sp]
MTRLSLRQIAGSLPPNEARELRAAFKQAFPTEAGSKKDYPCNSCGFTPNRMEQEGGRKLRTCSGCRKVDRLIFYCSSECQRRDWKHGKPYPHKAICGKPLTEREICDLPSTKSFYSAEDLIPDAEPQFQRSTALSRQISCLLTDLWLDYVLFVPENTDPGGQKRINVMFDLRRKPQFILHRNRALKNGDASAVQIMYALLLGGVEGEISPTQSDEPISPSLIRSQLEEEYGVIVDSTPPSVQDQHRLSMNATSEELALIDHTLNRVVDPERMQSMKQLLKTCSPTPYLIGC